MRSPPVEFTSSQATTLVTHPPGCSASRRRQALTARRIPRLDPLLVERRVLHALAAVDEVAVDAVDQPVRVAGLI